MLLSISTFTNAQTNDFGTWTNVTLKSTPGKWDISFEAELRTRDNASEIQRWSIGLEGGYKPVKHLETGLGYQLIDLHDTEYDDYQLRSRYYVYLLGKYKTGNFNFQIRERLQVTTKDATDRIKESGETDTYRISPDVVWRNKVRCFYNIPHFPVNPSFAVETFYQLNNPEGNSFEKIRFELAFTYKVIRHHALEISGITDREIHVAQPVHRYILGIGYVYTF